MLPGPAAPLRPTASCTLLVGNPKPRSRTRAVLLRAAELLRYRLAEDGIRLAEPVLVDLIELPVEQLVPARDGRGRRPLVAEAVAEAVAAVTGARLLLVASPTFKGTFTGLLKLFVDVLPRQALAGTVAVPVMTAAHPAHRHAVESYLRPLLVALGAAVPTPGLSVLEAELGSLDRVLAGWSEGAVPVLRGLLATPDRERLLTGA
jgi:FMN reductase